jgi:hypothetical protein
MGHLLSLGIRFNFFSIHSLFKVNVAKDQWSSPEFDCHQVGLHALFAVSFIRVFSLARVKSAIAFLAPCDRLRIAKWRPDHQNGKPHP